MKDLIEQAKNTSQKLGLSYVDAIIFLFKQQTLDSYVKENYPLEKLREERKNG